MDKSKWEYKKLGDCCKVINGLWTGKKPPFINVGVIRNANFTKSCELDNSNIAYIDVEQKAFEKRKLIKGDIIIEKSGGSDKQPVGRPILFNMDGDFSFSNFTSTLRVEDCKHLDSKYLHKVLKYNYLMGHTKAMQSNTTGLHNLDFTKYKAQIIPIPSFADQQRIVAELDCLNEMIALKQEQLKEFDKLAQSIFYDMFGDPVANDKGWTVTKLNELCKLCQGLAINSKSKHMLSSTGELPLLRIKDMKDGTREIFVNPKECPPSCIADVDDIIYTRTGTLGLVFTNMRGVLHNNCFKINIDKSLLSKTYFMELVGGDFFKNRIVELAKRSSQPDVTHKLFLSQSIILPPLALQQQFADKISAIEAQKELVKKSIAETQHLLDSRMDYYFN